MRNALFGKVHAKRDFVAPHAPRHILEVWEPWLQASLSASWHALDAAWIDYFTKAPIWRFWLGSDICGGTVAGALMPSLDAVGRYYPLAVFVWPGPDEAIAPPELDAHEEWFAASEALLLATLNPDVPFTATLAGLDALPLPRPGPAASGIEALGAGAIALGLDGPPGPIFARLRLADWDVFYAGRSFWWTAGGPGFRPRALTTPMMPQPALFAGMLTGELGRAGASA